MSIFKSILVVTLILFKVTCYADLKISTPGDHDTVLRALLPKAIIIQKPGGEGILAINSLKAGDTNLLSLGTSALLVAPTAIEKYPIDIEKELEVVTILAETPVLLVSKKDRYNSLDVAFKKNTKVVYVGGYGNISTCAVATNLLRKKLPIEVVYVPYKNISQLIVDTENSILDITCLAAGFVDYNRMTVLANLGSANIGYYKIPGFPEINVRFFLLSNKNLDNTLYSDIMETLQKNQKQFNITNIYTVISDKQLTKQMVDKDTIFWKTELQDLLKYNKSRP